MQVSNWPYCSNQSPPPLISCSRHGHVAVSSFNLLTIYKNSSNGLKPISSSKSFDNTITSLSWCKHYDSDGNLPYQLLIGFDNGKGIIFDIILFSIVSTFTLSESALTSSEWSNSYSNHFFIGCQNGDLISVSLVKAAENDSELSVVVSWIVSCSFPIDYLHISHNDSQMIMVASNQGKFAIYNEVYNESPSFLFTGSFEEDEQTIKDKQPNQNLSAVPTPTANFNSIRNMTATASSSSTILEPYQTKVFIQCGFHPHTNDIFFFVTQNKIYYGFIKEQTTVSLFPGSSFNRIVGIFFPQGHENSLVVIQRSSILLLTFSPGFGWKQKCEVSNPLSATVSFSPCHFDKDSFLIASKGHNLSIVKYYRRKLFYVTFMRHLVTKPTKIAVNGNFYAFVVDNSKNKIHHNPLNNFYLYLAPQLSCLSAFCLVYNISISHNYQRNYCNTQSFKVGVGRSSQNEIVSVCQIEWVSDTDLVFSARCSENKHKLFFFNYRRRELVSILKPQLEFLFVDYKRKEQNSGNNSSENFNLNLNLAEMKRNENSASSSIILAANQSMSSSAIAFSMHNLQLAQNFTSYYSYLINNEMSIRIHAHSNRKYFAATIGNLTLQFFVTAKSENPKPLLFEKSSVFMLPDPAAVSFIDESSNDDFVSIFYKNRIDICCISSSSPDNIKLELVNSYDYHTELKYIPILAHSFSQTFHLIVLENGEIDVIRIKADDSLARKNSPRDARKISVDSNDAENLTTRKMSADSIESEAAEETDEVVKYFAFVDTLGKMPKATCLRTSSDGESCIVVGRQARAENVAFITPSKNGKSKISIPKEKARVKRCEFISNSLILANIVGSHCFTFCSFEDRSPIDTPHAVLKDTTLKFEDLKEKIIEEIQKGPKKMTYKSSYASLTPAASLSKISSFSYSPSRVLFDPKSSIPLVNNTSLSSSFDSTTNSGFTTNEEMDFSTDDNEEMDVSDTSEKMDVSDSSDKADIPESKSETPNEKADIPESKSETPTEKVEISESKSETPTEKVEHSPEKITVRSMAPLSVPIRNKIGHFNPNLNASSSTTFSPTKEVSLSSYDTLVDVHLVIHLCERIGLFNVSDLLRSVSQRYDPFCYGINMDENYLIHYLRSFSEMLGESQPQPLNRRQAIYQELSHDHDGAFARLLTVGATEGGNPTKDMLKIALAALQLNEENFQMMLDVLLKNGFDEDATDIIFFSGKYDYRAVERFIEEDEVEFAIIALRTLIGIDKVGEAPNADEKKERLIKAVIEFFSEKKRKHQIVPFLLGMRRFEQAASYLESIGDSNSAKIVRALVVLHEKNHNGKDGKIFLDYSKL